MSDVVDTKVHALRHSPDRVTLRRARTENAAAAFGPISRGLNVLVIAHGQFSMVDVIEHVAREIGPCALSAVTWTVGNKDAEELHLMRERGALTSVRLVVDRSLITRDQANVERMVDQLGAENFRATQTHAKLTVLRSERFAVSVRASANMNSNPRLEQFDLTEGAELATFLEGFIDYCFDTLPRGLENHRLPAGGTNDAMLRTEDRDGVEDSLIATAFDAEIDAPDERERPRIDVDGLVASLGR